MPFRYPYASHIGAPQPHAASHMVWAVPRSLATTDGISFDFYSCRYLDVSVPCVRLVRLCIQRTMTGFKPGRVAPFGNLRIKAC
jgi:hypothetical protein